MNRLKSIFIMFYMMMGMFIFAHGGINLFNTNFSLVWLGVIIVTGLPVGFLSFLMIFRSRARTSGNLPLLSAIVTAGFFLTVSGYLINSPSSVLPLIYGFIGFFGWFLYNFWYSRLGRKTNEVLAKGNQLPSFLLEDVQGKSFDSKSLIGKPALMLFYRGNWCPLCMAQIKEIAAQYRELESRGVEMVLISPQSHKNSIQLAEQFDVPFKFLIDVNNQAAKQLGIFQKNGVPMGMEMLGYDSDTVLPTVLITDKDGKIIFADLTDNYRVRPEPETFIRVLDEYSKKSEEKVAAV